ncbi:MAG: DUF3868 domain-containing protein [Bacteroides sp.]|nr:DUF3868 domain-containing protein [Bacteroides sp.]
MKPIFFNLYLSGLMLLLSMPLASQTVPTVDGAVILHNLAFDQTAGRLTLSFEAEVIEKAMNYRQSWTIIPELISPDGLQSRIYPTILINGTQKHRHHKRKMSYKNRDLLANLPLYKVKVLQDTTQVIFYQADIPYEDWMEEATLTLHQILTSSREKKQLFTTGNIARVSPEKMIIEKVTEIAPMPLPRLPEVEPAIYTAEGTAYIQFPINESVIRTDFRDNRVELAKIENDIREILTDHTYTLIGIYLTGYASPEGRYEFNEGLSQARTQALKDHIVKKYGISPDEIWVTSVAEDWTRLREMIVESDLADKPQIIDIIDSSGTPDAKEKRLQALGTTWRTLLNDYFPNLRRVDYQLLYQKR